MDVIFRRGAQEVTLKAKASPSASPTFELPDAAAGTHELADLDTAQTMSNKTLTTPVVNGTISGTAIQDDDTFASPAANKLASSESIKAYVDAVAAAQNEASEITYDNTTSLLTATDVQAAIDEVEGRLDTAESGITTNASSILDHINDTVDAHDASAISYDNSTSSLTATEVQAAIDEVEGRLDTAEADIVTLDGRLDQPNWDLAAVTLATNTFTLASAIVQDITSTDSSNLQTLTGTPAGGDVKVIRNSSGEVVTIENGAGANQITTGTGLDLRLADEASIILRFNGTAWDVVGGAGGGGGLTLEKQTTNFAAVQGFHYLVDSSGGPITVTLPAGASQAVIRLSDISDSWGSNNITVTPDGAETIDGASSLTLDVEGVWVQLMWDGTEWVTDDPIDPALVSGNGMETADNSSGDVTVASGRTRMHPYLTILAADTYTINGRLVAGQSLDVSGSLVVNGSVVVHNLES